jgi:cyclic pyranopterin phosphate synthase
MPDDLTPSDLSHVDAAGKARMVDVSPKAASARRAVAEGVVRVAPATLAAIRQNAVQKGDVLAVARIAGIQAAKQTSAWIPLCHPLRLDAVSVDLALEEPWSVRIRAEARAFDRTGVEMEALTAVAAAALTVYDMVKAIDRDASIERVRLLEKDGGKSGPWRAREGS